MKKDTNNVSIIRVDGCTIDLMPVLEFCQELKYTAALLEKKCVKYVKQKNRRHKNINGRATRDLLKEIYQKSGEAYVLLAQERHFLKHKSMKTKLGVQSRAGKLVRHFLNSDIDIVMED